MKATLILWCTVGTACGTDSNSHSQPKSHVAELTANQESIRESFGLQIKYDTNPPFSENIDCSQWKDNKAEIFLGPFHEYSTGSALSVETVANDSGNAVFDWINSGVSSALYSFALTHSGFIMRLTKTPETQVSAGAVVGTSGDTVVTEATESGVKPVAEWRAKQDIIDFVRAACFGPPEESIQDNNRPLERPSVVALTDGVKN